MTKNQVKDARRFYDFNLETKWRSKRKNARYDEDKLVQEVYGYQDYMDMRDAHMMKNDGHEHHALMFAKMIELAHDVKQQRRFTTRAEKDLINDYLIDYSTK